MALFGPPRPGDYPRQWKDMSLEFKLMFVYHGCMMALFITGGAFTLRQELTFASVLVFVLTSVSIKHRRSAGWRWQGLQTKNLLIAAGGIALMGVFLYAATPLFPPSNPRALPWYLAGFGIVAFNVLHALRLVLLPKLLFWQIVTNQAVKQCNQKRPNLLNHSGRELPEPPMASCSLLFG
jgi:hypothetical protein